MLPQVHLQRAQNPGFFCVKGKEKDGARGAIQKKGVGISKSPGSQVSS